MSSDSIKKRRIADEGSNNDDIGVGSDGSSTAAIIAEMKEHMMCMQNEMDGMQNEMNGMKSRLSHMGELENKCQRQEEKCNILEERCDSLERSIEILNKENNWKYSAPAIPDSHWTGLGFNAEYIDSMESLVACIKMFTCRLRSGVYDEIDLGLETEDIPILQHDDALLPHWKELANAIQLSPSNAFESKGFELHNVQLTSSVMDLLTPTLKGKLFDTLYLESNNFVSTCDGVKFAVEAVKSISQLKAFYLANNQLETMENARAVLDAIISHPSINKVRLENCLRGDMNGYEALCYLLSSSKSFENIDFDNNNISTGGGTEIPDYIDSNPPLEHLCLEKNKLNDNDAVLIARALKQNTKNLERLDLDNNDITHIGKEALLKAVYDPTSLNSISDCNHTCNISGIGNDLPLWCKNPGYTDPKSKRSMKMHYILSLRHREGSNVQHLNVEFDEDKDGDDTSLSLKIVPKVLEAVSKHSNNEHHDCRPPLSIMYEILRGGRCQSCMETGE